MFPSDMAVTEIIVSPDICDDAYFKLDKPLAVKGECFHLIRGQFFIETSKELELISGRWKRFDHDVVKAENRRIHERAKNTSKDTEVLS